jgi:guanylate kinase
LVGSVPTLLLVGISGAGKDTINHQLLTTGHYHRIVTHTTRQPRHNHGILETDGVEYHFIDYPTAENLLKSHGFIEAKVYSNNVYGSSIGEFQLAHDEGKIALADIDVQGVAEYMQLIPGNVRPLFLLPPDYETWQHRLFSRYGDSHTDHVDDLRLRTEAAARELEELLAKDYYFVLINDDLDETVRAADEIARSGVQPTEQKAAALEVARAILTRVREHSRPYHR